MKTNKLFPLLMLLATIGTFSQPRLREKMEQIKSLKVAYITDELKLTTDEAAKFWPVYNTFEDKQKELRQEKLRSYLDRLDGGEIDRLSDKEAADLLTKMESAEDELYQLRKKFVVGLKGIISPVKIIKLKKAEEGFNRKLLKQYRDKVRN